MAFFWPTLAFLAGLIMAHVGGGFVYLAAHAMGKC